MIDSSVVRRRELITWRSSYVLGAILCLFYTVLMYYTPVAVIPIAGHDDGHYIHQGIELTRGHWIGGYGHMTLIKGPGLPIFLALSKASGLPYSISLALVEAGSFFLLSFVVGRLANAPGLALLMLVALLGFPWMWSESSLRVLRDGFYTSLILIFLALSFVVIWSEHGRRRYLTLAAGVALGFASITREENPWLLPGIALLILALFVVERRRSGGFAPFLMIVLWAAIGFVGVRGTIVTINYAKYKTFAVADVSETNYRNALSALHSVEPPQRVPYFSPAREARLAVYEVSPTFTRLRGLIDDDRAPLSGWQGAGCRMYGGRGCSDYMTGWFPWVFRDAVSLVGDYVNARTAAAFYRQVAEEIGRACANKQLACRYHPIAEIPPLVRENFILMFGSAIKTVKLITLSLPMSAERPRSQGPADMLRYSMAFLNLSFIAPEESEPRNAIVSGANQPPVIIFTKSAQNKIRILYNTIWPTVCVLGVLAILFSTYVRLTTTGIDRLLVMTWILFIFVAARAGLLIIVDASVHPGATVDYANVAAYCLAAAVVMSLYLAAQDVKTSLRRGQHPLQDATS